MRTRGRRALQLFPPEQERWKAICVRARAARWRTEPNDTRRRCRPGASCDRRLTQPPEAVLAHDLSAYTLILCVRQPRNIAEPLAELAWNVSPPVPLLAARSSGFQAMLSVSVAELGIVETHPDSLVDLRLTRPFPELVAHAHAVALDPADSMARAHIPYVVLLLRALDEWRMVHGTLPATADRAAFKEFLHARRPAQGDDENHDEALAALAPHVWRPLQTPAVPPDVVALLDDTQCRSVTAHSSPFWLLVAALRAFVNEAHVLPLTGALPDMKATSHGYVALQNVYVAKARSDLARFHELLEHILAAAGTTREAAALDDDTVRTFVRHAAHLKLVRGRRLGQQRTDPTVGAMAAAFADVVNPVTVQYYLAFVAADTFFVTYGRYPGTQDAVTSADRTELFRLALAYARDVGLAVSSDDAHKLELACLELYVSHESSYTACAVPTATCLRLLLYSAASPLRKLSRS